MVDPVPNLTNQNSLVYRSLPVSSKEIELFIALNYLAGAVKTYKFTHFHFLLVAVECALFVTSFTPCVTLLYFLENPLSNLEGRSCVGNVQ